MMDLSLQAVYKGTGKGKRGFSKGQNWNWKGWRKELVACDIGHDPRKEEKGKKRVAKENPEHVGRAAKMMRICKHGACWKKVRTNSGKR